MQVGVVPQTIGRRLKNMERVLKKIKPALLEKLKKSSVPLNSESMKQLSPELLEKVSGGWTTEIGGYCRNCGAETIYYWASDEPHDYSEGIFCETCGAVYHSAGNFDVNYALTTI
jgi:hypothetical protein